MIAVDTNILVYAHRADSPQHEAAFAALAELDSSRQPWAVPWPCLHEFLAIVTHPRGFSPPSSLDAAIEATADLLEMPDMRPLTEADDHEAVLLSLLRTSGVIGPKVHDARVAAICLSHGVSTLWSADRDFSYFPALRTLNPLVR